MARNRRRLSENPSPTTGAAVKTRPLCIEAADALPEVIVDAPAVHPLIYAKRVVSAGRSIEPGETVAVRHRAGNHLGFGIYNPKSEIRVRMICVEPREGSTLPDRPPTLPDRAHWESLMDRAVRLRVGTLRLDDRTDAYRVVHAESDGFSGLVVDRFGPVLSAEAFSFGMLQRIAPILEGFAGRLGTSHWHVRCGPSTLSHEGFAIDPFASPDCPRSVVIQENGCRFRVRFEGGHKTGFFCDQRENRERFAELAAGKTVLDVCCYTGGFAVHAARNRAIHVTAVDVDQAPLEQAKENANLNQTRVEFVLADAFSYMRDIGRGGRTFQAVALDPPKLIRSRAELEEGSVRHLDLNRLAFCLVAPGGLLLTCSCAGLLGEEEFLKLVHRAARQAGRTFRVLATTGAAADHPVHPACRETRYLKALWLYVD